MLKNLIYNKPFINFSKNIIIKPNISNYYNKFFSTVSTTSALSTETDDLQEIKRSRLTKLIKPKIKKFCEDFYFKNNIPVDDKAIETLENTYYVSKDHLKNYIEHLANRYHRKSYLYKKDTLLENLTNYSSIRENANRYTEIPMEKQRKIVKDILFSFFRSDNLDYFYDLRYTDFLQDPDGKLLLGYYSGSMVRIAYGVFPENEWIPNLFRRNIIGIEEDYNFKAELEWYARRNNIHTAEDWACVDVLDLEKKCKLGFKNKNKTIKLILDCFPELNIRVFLIKGFNTPIFKYYDNEKLYQQYATYLIEKTGFTYMEQFYFMTNGQISRLNGQAFLLHSKKSRKELFKRLYPNFQWEDKYFDLTKYLGIKNKKDKEKRVAYRNKIEKLDEMISKFKLD
ncbi:hypothetical protein DICPUDRAFT_78063 [Dictyostelium purpureum]|uniref:Uncharacterized protein n=1 Tax=Dictyostelium purpureum TaxID=5786 RepID=F0ZIF8_DICPU|nr:uncharacterized protein DICPUDRAFT_78063 [Dictyostelium purpureum]EGC36251.1 hypothetical protein DICPUDRAFT_78063 [Dictyostelium purpureum]|eukprot:XP_003287197.1 hypothetical protein DICPUDRAFT_78063 [Dictyostelium purpureum]